MKVHQYTLQALLLLSTALLGSSQAKAEDAAADASGLGQLESGSVEGGFSLPAPPTFVPGDPTPPPSDRKAGQVMAKVMAMAAASQQKIACGKMMSEAMKSENKKDKALLMAMANQMCAQADQTMASAMKNDEGQKKLGSDIPKMAELKIAPITLGKDKIKEAEVPKITFNDEAGKTGSETPDFPVVQPFKVPNLNSQVFNKPSTSDDLKDPITDFTKPSQLQRLEPINLGTDKKEEARNGLSQSAPGQAFGGSAGSNSPAKGSSENALPTGSTAAAAADSARIRGGLATSESAGGGGSESTEKSGSSLDLSSMMAQMMGGGQTGEGGGGPEVVSINTKTAEDALLNLFEYASVRYQKLGNEKGSIRRRKTEGIRLPAQTTVAQVPKD